MCLPRQALSRLPSQAYEKKQEPGVTSMNKGAGGQVGSMISSWPLGLTGKTDWLLLFFLQALANPSLRPLSATRQRDVENNLAPNATQVGRFLRSKILILLSSLLHRAKARCVEAP